MTRGYETNSRGSALKRCKYLGELTQLANRPLSNLWKKLKSSSLNTAPRANTFLWSITTHMVSFGTCETSIFVRVNFTVVSLSIESESHIVPRISKSGSSDFGASSILPSFSEAFPTKIPYRWNTSKIVFDTSSLNESKANTLCRTSEMSSGRKKKNQVKFNGCDLKKEKGTGKNLPSGYFSR